MNVPFMGTASASPVRAHMEVATYSSSPELWYGAEGTAVKTLQRDLDHHGSHLTVDGVFGPATLRAVKSFQHSHGLSTDGIVGSLTWAALRSSEIPRSLSRLGITRVAYYGAIVHGASLDINRRAHRLYFLRLSSRGHVYLSRYSVVSFAGCNRDGCFTTPNGVFQVVRKAGAHERSKMWHNAPMPWALYFTWSGYAVHYDPLGPSHGCIHVPYYDLMEFVYDHTPIGAYVVIHT
ncbi:MAG TPA: L,D-transpeptidase family protein [Candidatus Saccharimonadaceae bacterium]|nr:L,D-transpeptidase family protein [Candidatus Saccharimonadaceae bacterium]